MPVVGTIGAMKMYSEWRPVPVAFMPMLTIDTSYIPESAHILVRLKEGVQHGAFSARFPSLDGEGDEAGAICLLAVSVPMSRL